MTYEEFKHLAEHPQHRDVPAIFKLEVLETEELEEKKRSHYPKYKVNTYCPQAFTTTLEEAERLMHQDVQYRKKMKEEDDYPLDTFCYYISEIPLGLLHYDRECLSERVYDGEGKLIDQSYCCSGSASTIPESAIRQHTTDIPTRPSEAEALNRSDSRKVTSWKYIVAMK
ncbi:MAG: hypothetical protein V8T23_03405 [Prevotella sp.]